MNSFEGKIKQVGSHGSLSIVSVEMALGHRLQSIIIDTPESVPYLKENQTVRVLFKETEIILATEPETQLSVLNRFAATIEEIDEGRLLSRIELQTEMGFCVAIVPSESLAQLHLKKGRTVYAFVKINDVLLAP
ncbi:TOBE domain-containing protein [Marinilongibacter aquaticus]|uniref:TOBE domain-containing protein n=1 Tax=Marinilongibacter aquaticus TaxID=2975157 RepID=UPI0021BDAB74|nr:TOBE domain-containing protein [Marinilongibacter aquaticus]UBM59803.1 TOBE domain-containing protein [Marinilongibacter aquaticus]